jgi:hypothetical protein
VPCPAETKRRCVNEPDLGDEKAFIVEYGVYKTLKRLTWVCCAARDQHSSTQLFWSHLPLRHAFSSVRLSLPRFACKLLTLLGNVVLL